jgi:LAS superfamily LD-carboxypeptidase LdcB
MSGLLLALAAVAACAAGPADAAAANAASLETFAFAPFRRPETGWAVYAPRVAAEIGSTCPADSPGFAAALSSWQAAHKLPATGAMDIESFAAMNGKWTLARPWVQATRHGGCPEAPATETLATAAPAESYGGKTIQLTPETLRNWRALMAAAKAEMPEMAADPRWLTVFSGFRAPDADTARCLAENNCDGTVRAVCSAHRTGIAIDAYVGEAPGARPDSSEDANRRAMTQTAVYRWLVANAARFGFVNYVFEPWHWEYAAPLDSGTAVTHGAKP